MTRRNVIVSISLVIIALAGSYACMAFVANDTGDDLFKQADRDGNGTLDKGEFTAYLNLSQRSTGPTKDARPAGKKDPVRICPHSGKVCDGQGGCCKDKAGAGEGGCCKDKASAGEGGCCKDKAGAGGGGCCKDKAGAGEGGCCKDKAAAASPEPESVPENAESVEEPKA